MNEGANKGILVTTADYGPDVYEFAKNKPLTLLNGRNSLHMLEKHGYKVKRDLKEAKLLNSTEYSYAAEPPVQRGESHLSRLTEPLITILLEQDRVHRPHASKYPSLNQCSRY